MQPTSSDSMYSDVYVDMLIRRDEEERRRGMATITALFGPSGSGKSTQACGWPGPVTYFDLEYGLSRVWGIKQDGGQWWYGDKEISRFFYELTPQFISSKDQKVQGCLETWLQFTQDFDRACKKRQGTIIIDTATIIWKMCCDAYLQQLQSIKPRERLIEIEYGEPNRRMGLIFDTARMYGVNLVLIQHERDEYIPLIEPISGLPQMDNGRPITVTTGKKLPDGYKYTIAKSDWVLYSCLLYTSPSPRDS